MVKKKRTSEIKPGAPIDAGFVPMRSVFECERRFFAQDVSHRSTGNGKRVITGSFAVYNQLTELRPGIFEKIEPGCFANAISGFDDVRCLINHDPSSLAGRTRSGTLRLADSPRAATFECEVSEKQSYVINALESIDRGDMSGCSFQFDTIEDSVAYDRAADTITRTLRRAKTYDVGPVTFPAYEQTSVFAAIRSIALGDARASSFGSVLQEIRSSTRRSEFRAIAIAAQADLAAVVGPTADECALAAVRAAKLGDVSLEDLAAAIDHIRSGARDEQRIALVRSTILILESLIGPTAEQRAASSDIDRRLGIYQRAA